ncbi:MAG TPA: hypothetical protein DCM40_36010 [Maribacter sp.]|nr:hypothetical protein [Maribacter sp.]
MALSHDNLENYYRTNFILTNNFKYTLTELDNMMPWEREIYLTLLNEYFKKMEEQQKNNKQGMM